MRKCVIAAITLVFTILASGMSGYGFDYPPQPAPEMLEIYPVEEYQRAIGYNEFDGYYTDFRWSPLKMPDPSDVADRQYLNFYIQKVSKGYRPPAGLELKVEGFDGSETQMRMKQLDSGTVYYSHMSAYYTDIEEGQVVYTSPQSMPSNTVKFLTELDITAVPSGMNEILIKWDDVWNSGGRINYRLYVSESADFSNTPPIYITGDLIGPGRPVMVRETEGKLEYRYRVPDPGRVYYIKVEPDVVDESLKKPEESRVVIVSSYIIARTVRMATTEQGTIWKMEWSPVITGLDTSQVNISYQIYRGITGSSELPQYVAQTDDTNFFVTIREDDPEYYFIIRAIITLDGQELYPGIRIESMRIEVKESEVPSNPAAPEIVSQVFDNYGNEITSYESELKPDSATVFWEPPRKGTGEIDTGVRYDIWLITDPTDIDNPPEMTRIETNLQIDTSRQVKDGSVVKAFKYEVEGLSPNDVYYFMIQARKEFVDYVDEILQNVVYSSEPSLKIIVTPVEGSIEKPVAPGRPPLAIKKGPPPDEKPMVSNNTAVITLKDKWYEAFDEEENRWVAVAAEDLDEIDDTLVESLESGEYEGYEYRIVEYDQGVTLNVGCIPYVGGMSPDDLKAVPAEWVLNFPAVPNDPNEEPMQNPDGRCHNIDITVSALEPNETYIIWARAVRMSVGLMSAPSDPIVFTTDPEITVVPERPTVPEFNYYYAGDMYVDLGWDFRPGYNYHIRYGKTDRLSDASALVTVTPDDLMASTYYTVSGLEQNTLYYFWIQAETFSEEGEGLTSEWSSSLVIKTLPYEPPETPNGFGIKSGEDSITKNSISYEWDAVSGLEYILEISDNIEYDELTRYLVGSVSSFTVEELYPNRRYYARLYAYDSFTDLESKPTSSISVRTLKSGDEYDTDEDTEFYPPGEIWEIEPAARMGIWTIKIIGIYADQFIEQAAKSGPNDMVVPAGEPPAGTKKIRLIASGDIFSALSTLGKAFILETWNADYVIRPGSLDNIGGRLVEIIATPESSLVSLPEYLTPTVKPSELQVRFIAEDGGYSVAGRFALPVKVLYAEEDYFEGLAGAFLDETSGNWEEKHLSCGVGGFTMKEGVSIDMDAPGTIVLGFKNKDMYVDVSTSRYRSSINNIASRYDLKSNTGSRFRPEDEITRDEAVKFVFDVLGAGYGTNASASAAKAGIMDYRDVGHSHLPCTRENAMDMIVRTYELIVRSDVHEDPRSITIFDDMDKISPEMAGNVAFAVSNGLVANSGSRYLLPKEKISRGEFMLLLERCLELAQNS